MRASALKRPTNGEEIIFKKKKDMDRCLVGRNGDYFLQPFQCDLCWFQNLQNGDHVTSSRVDTRSRRGNQDLLWSGAS